ARAVGKGRRRGLQLAALVEDLDAALGVLETGVAEPRELHAALVEGERLLEREVAILELLHDRLELGDRRLEILDRCVHLARVLRGRAYRSYLAIELSARQTHVNLLAAGDRRGVAQHAAAIGVPGDRVAAPQDPERAERLEPPDDRAQPRVRAIVAARGGMR